MKKETKTLIAKEIIINFKLVMMSLFVCAIICFIYAIIKRPPITKYTCPERTSWFNDNWPKTDDGPAVFAYGPNVGVHYRAYFSNEYKYDGTIATVISCPSKISMPSYNIRIRDVINYINNERLEYFKQDIFNLLKLLIIVLIPSAICLRYIYLALLWIKKYGTD